MMGRRLFGKLLALLCVIGLSLSSYAAEPIKIGSVLAISGGASYIGEPEAKTLKLYVDQINASGGVLGRPLQLIMYDDSGDANNARTLTTRLVEQDKVNVIVGGSTTGTTMAMIPVVQAAQIPFMSIAGGTPIVEPVRRWVFKSPHTDRMACQRIFADMQKRKLTNIALISGTDGFGLSMREQCQKVAPQYGIHIVVEQSYGAQDTDMTPQLTKVKNTPGVQAILNTGASGQGAAVLTRNYGQLGMKNIPFYQNPGVASKSFIQLAGPASEGVRLPAAALLVASKLPASDPQKSVVVNYTKTFEKATGQPVSTFGGGAYDGLMMVVDAIKAAKSTDPEKIRDALDHTKGFIGTAGVVNMTPQDHLGLTVDAFRMLEIKNGDWMLIQ